VFALRSEVLWDTYPCIVVIVPNMLSAIHCHMFWNETAVACGPIDAKWSSHCKENSQADALRSEGRAKATSAVQKQGQGMLTAA